MFQRIKFAATVAALAVSGSAFAATSFGDGSFEAQGAASTTNYCYFDMPTAGGPACAPGGLLGGWTGAGAGIQHETNSAWPGAQTADGSYYGFVQGAGILGQLFFADAGDYALNWADAGRPSGVAGGDQSYTVSIIPFIDAVFGTPIQLGTYSTTTNQPFGARTAPRFTLAQGGAYVLAFQGTNPNGGDNTAFIDAVALGAVPEPATWAMMIGGMGVVGGSLRSRRRVALSAA